MKGLDEESPSCPKRDHRTKFRFVQNNDKCFPMGMTGLTITTRLPMENLCLLSQTFSCQETAVVIGSPLGSLPGSQYGAPHAVYQWPHADCTIHAEEWYKQTVDSFVVTTGAVPLNSSRRVLLPLVYVTGDGQRVTLVNKTTRSPTVMEELQWHRGTYRSVRKFPLESSDWFRSNAFAGLQGSEDRNNLLLLSHDGGAYVLARSSGSVLRRADGQAVALLGTGNYVR